MPEFAVPEDIIGEYEAAGRNLHQPLRLRFRREVVSGIIEASPLCF